MSWLGLKGRRVLVTGAAGGIGRAIAEGFAAQGAILALFDRDAEGLERTRAALPGTTEAIPLDLSDSDAIAPAVEAAASRIGPPDILINVAAMSLPRSLATLTAEEFTLQMGVNTTAALLTRRRSGGCGTRHARARSPTSLPSPRRMPCRTARPIPAARRRCRC